MKILIQSIAVALVLGSAGTASAHHVKTHHHVGAYDALAAAARAPMPSTNVWSHAFESDTDPRSTATGGPVGGLGS